MKKWVFTLMLVLFSVLTQADIIFETKDGRDKRLSGVTVCYSGSGGTFAKGVSGGGYSRVILENPYPNPVTIYAFKEGYQTQVIRRWREAGEENWVNIALPKLNGRISEGPRVPAYCDSRGRSKKSSKTFEPRKKSAPQETGKPSAAGKRTSQSERQVIRLSGADAYALARRHGFNFSYKEIGFGTDCEIRPSGKTIYLKAMSPPPIGSGKCEFTLFDRRQLNDGWVFKRFGGPRIVTSIQGSFATIAHPTRGSSSLRLKVRSWHPFMYIDWIEIEGPKGEGITKAFAM